jgi:hypothetical protein
MAVRTPWLEAVRPVPGSLRLIGLRWLLWIVAAAPGAAATIAGLAEGPARRAFFADAPRPLPIVHLAAWTQEIPGAGLALLLGGACFAWLGNLMLTAAAVRLLAEAPAGRARVWRSIFDEGTRAIWPYLRVSVLAVVWAAIGLRLIGLIFERLADHATLAGWTGGASLITLNTWRILLALLWLSIVGAGAFWSRVIVVDDDRHFVRRMHGIVPRLFARRPLGGLVMHVLVSLGALAACAAVLAAWRQSPGASLGLFVLLWLMGLLLQAWVWHWRLRACLLTWRDPDLRSLRQHPDSPWHIVSRVVARVRSRFGARRSAEREATIEPGSASLPPHNG